MSAREGEAIVRARAQIRGRVQGVYYRASTREEALARGLRGFVRNRDDGGVELVAEGPRDAVLALLRWCEGGPPAARVDAVEVAWEAPDAPPFVDFVVRRG
ncbi:MAG: acylphosphatase [Nannocystaceae bacterium]